MVQFGSLEEESEAKEVKATRLEGSYFIAAFLGCSVQMPNQLGVIDGKVTQSGRSGATYSQATVRSCIAEIYAGDPDCYVKQQN